MRKGIMRMIDDCEKGSSVIIRCSQLFRAICVMHDDTRSMRIVYTACACIPPYWLFLIGTAPEYYLPTWPAGGKNLKFV